MMGEAARESLETTKDTDGVEVDVGRQGSDWRVIDDQREISGAVVSDNTISVTSRPGLELNDSDVTGARR